MSSTRSCDSDVSPGKTRATGRRHDRGQTEGDTLQPDRAIAPRLAPLGALAAAMNAPRAELSQSVLGGVRKLSPLRRELAPNDQASTEGRACSRARFLVGRISRAVVCDLANAQL